MLAELDAVADEGARAARGRACACALRARPGLRVCAPRARAAAAQARARRWARALGRAARARRSKRGSAAGPAPNARAGARLELALRGVFAGNVFDMGAAETAQRAEAAGDGGAAADFAKTRDSLLPRPWVRRHGPGARRSRHRGPAACAPSPAPRCPAAGRPPRPAPATDAPLAPARAQAVDDMDTLLARLAARRHAKALLFVDNAGADCVLGMLPLARELVKRGTQARARRGGGAAGAAGRGGRPAARAARGGRAAVALSAQASAARARPPPGAAPAPARAPRPRGAQVVLAANAAPSINDVTAGELRPLLARAAAADRALARAIAERALRVVASGNDLGVIDLLRVSPEVAAEAAGADLVVLEGMGRGIETNLRARFTCDAAKLGMVKARGRAVGRAGGRAAQRGPGRGWEGAALLFAWWRLTGLGGTRPLPPPPRSTPRSRAFWAGACTTWCASLTPQREGGTCCA